jgi:hypothetical protein
VMEETRRPIRLSDFAPLLFIIPLLGLICLYLSAASVYALGIEWTQYYHRNIYEPWFIGQAVWAVAAVALAIMFVVELVLIKLGKVYKFPSVALVVASTWNLLIGEATFFLKPLGCGFQSSVPPESTVATSLYIAAMTLGLLLAGIAAIKFNSIDGGFVKLARRMCFLNGILALAGLFVISVSGCISG